MYNFASLADVEAALEQFIPAQLPRPAYTLEQVSALMEYLGNPQDTIKAVHFAGTSGKTSSAYYAAALLQATGKRVGLLTSPHVESLTERVQINLQPLADAVFCTELAAFMNLVDKSGIRVSYAELLYAFAYWEFARLGLDYIVVETGLGGLLDATNVISRADKLCVITDISLDHTTILGKTLAAIAQQKAGIIQQHNEVFTYRQGPQIMQAFETASQQRQAHLHVIARAPEATIRQVAFLPLFQQHNFALVLEVIRFVIDRDNLPALTSQAIQAAARTHIPGRMDVLQVADHTLILDGAHNPHKLGALCQSIEQQYPHQSVAMLVSFIKGGGRNLVDMLQSLIPLQPHVIATVPAGASRHDWYRAAEIAAAAQTAGIISFMAIEDYIAAQQDFLQRPEQVLVVTGSLYALAPMHRFLVQHTGSSPTRH